MVTSDCLIQNRLRLPAVGRHWRRLTVATLLCWGVLAVENGAEQIDTGWIVATPEAGNISAANDGLMVGAKSAPQTPATATAIASESKQSDSRQRLVFFHVLEQTQMPLLPSPMSPQAAAEINASPKPAIGGQGSWRFAVRPDGIEGWRSAGPSFTPVGEPWQTEIHAPPVEAPVAAQTPVAATAGPPTIPNLTEKSTADRRIGKPSAGETPAEDEAGEPAVQQPIGGASRVDREEQTGPLSAASPAAAPPIKIGPPLTKQLVALRSRVRSVLKGYYRKTLNSRDNDPWEVMHGMLAYGLQSRIRQGSSRGDPVTSVGWLCYNKPCNGQTLMHVTPKGELRAKYGVGLQGHLGQLLAMLAQCRVSADYPIRVGERDFTIHDLIEAEKQTCYPKSELTFKLIALQYYLDLNDKWVNDQGVEWDIPRLIREELAQPIRGAACGGTHRLSSLSLTVKARVRRGEPVDGQYARAADFVKRNHQYAFKLQNRDGSLSTAWFQGSGDDRDIDRRIKTTGHILEWLCYSLSDEELRQQSTIRAVTYLANLMYSNYDREWEVGPMCHATHALLLYDERVFQPFDGSNYETAYKPKSKTATANRTHQETIRR